ncbi:hypothetical protein THAOC_11490 [Thalassiosira oceanica]|uniref:Uncharacterized protein n=1 Tax=Thalassiosira oceanica TaxID=159749 RepID=K0SQ44_THAOC|nr:hypothetical protein THAOC_11490 [Thalassiosira oceanica]|eukprot:EJK67470.1 hypothetical protein THAOC_11490 [Thalassiosira oceanica]
MSIVGRRFVGSDVLATQSRLSRVSLLQAADVAGNRLSPNRADDGNRERYCLVPSSARFGDMSSDETAATEFNDSVDAMGAVIGPPGEAMEELDSRYRRCAGRADRARQGAVVALQMRRAIYAQGTKSDKSRA